MGGYIRKGLCLRFNCFPLLDAIYEGTTFDAFEGFLEETEGHSLDL